MMNWLGGGGPVRLPEYVGPHSPSQQSEGGGADVQERREEARKGKNRGEGGG